MSDAMRILMVEIERYLAAVDAFRAEQCEPRWLPEEAGGELRRPRLAPG